MKLGKINFFFIIYFSIFIPLSADDKIITTPVINLENLEPSYERLDQENNNENSQKIDLKKRNINEKEKKDFNYVNLIGLDKITAKTSPIKIKLGETTKFGLLEIKALKCGISKNSKSDKNSVAYLQVRDISENQNEKVFIFNGWTFSSNPSLTPIDHAIYDIWLVGCESV